MAVADPFLCRGAAAVEGYPVGILGNNGVLDVYAGEKLVMRFIKIDKLSTATGTQDSLPRPYRFGYGVLDVLTASTEDLPAANWLVARLRRDAGYRTGVVSNQPLLRPRGFTRGFEDIQVASPEVGLGCG